MQWKPLKAFIIASLVLPAATGWAQSTYSNAIVNLSPAGYWPMHEVEAAAQGDIETNYGTLGLLGTAYYPDWATPLNGAGIKRGAGGALANDPDQSVYFDLTPNGATGPSADTFTNALYVPHASPLSTLTPPFSVECWFYPVSANDSEDIWGQNGYEGLNAGTAGAGQGKVCGIRLVWENGTTTGFELYTYKNSSTLETIGFSGVSGQNLNPINNWYHLVVTCDSQTNLSLYTNGVLAFTKAAATLYSPDYWTPITIGGCRGGTKAVTGDIDEFAVYTNAITDMYQHYLDGISESQAGQYVAAVQNDNPAIYLRMDAPATYTTPNSTTWPALMNYGRTNGTVVGNGVYAPGTLPGILAGPVNPAGVPLTGLSGPTVPLLSGMSSFGDAGSSPIYNPTGSNANFSVTALFRGNPCDNRVQSIVGHGTNSWQLAISTSGSIVFNAGNGNKSAGGTGSAAGDMQSAGVFNDGYWHQVVAVNQTNVITLYVDGQLNTNGTPSGIAPTNIIPGNALDVMIGADPNYTNIPAGAGRQFAGQICDVAYFTNALTLSQVQGLFNAAGIVPYISTQPVSSGANQNSAFTNIVVAGGSQPLAFQWYTNGVALAGQTNANLVLNPVTSNEASTNYYLVITNNYGSVTSAVVSLAVFSAPTISAQYPVTYTNLLNTNFLTLYTGASPTFMISAAGLQPISYYWFTNGTLDGAVTVSNLIWPDAQIGSFTAYCLLSNSLGTATSSVWSASIIADPANSANGLAPYPQSVLALHPIAYWRLNEGNENGSGDDGYLAYDYAGGNNGTYTNVILGNNGYNPATDPSDTSAEFGEFGEFIPIVDNFAGQIEGVDFGTPNGGNAEFTVEAWVNGFAGTGSQMEGGPVATKGLYGVSDEFNLGIDSTKEHYRFYIRTANGTMYVVGSGTSPIIDGNWHHVVGVCDQANGVASLYYDGQLVNTDAIPAGAGLYESANPLTIGAATGDGTNYTYQFNGYINDVAVYNYAMSASQVQGEYSSIGIQPVLIQSPPTALTTNGNGPLTISAAAIGTPPIGYQWYDVSGGTNVAAGSTNGEPLNLSLTVSNVPPGWNGDQLELIVTNAFGSTNVYVALNIVTNPPQITANLPSPVTVYTGVSYTYSIGVSGPLTLAYQWYQAGTPIAGQTNSAYTVTAGSPGSTTYYVVITNLYGVVTSSVSMFTSAGIPQLTAAYDTGILGLKPVGYWPMHEVESPAPGDMEANYGSLGLLGAGFYPDWSTSSGAFLRGYPGPLANGGDKGVEFTYPNSDNGALTNSLFVPHTSPSSTLNAPFSVECWFYPTNNVNQGDIWSQSGDAGLNSGYASGSGNVGGMRMDWNGTNGGFNVFSYYNNPNVITLIQKGSVAPAQWYHLVVTCDANTNVSLYVNGSQVSTVAAVGQYTPDFWTPFREGAGNGSGGFRAVAGIISEVAVYTNVLPDVSTHYNDAISGASGVYYDAVTNDNPVIYLRMNSTNYVAPPVSTWPLLINYGSVAVNGVYTPGTAPGIVSGPEGPGGMPFEGLSGDVPQFNGVSSFADAGYAAVYNPVGASPFSVAAMFRGNPCDGRAQAIVGHSSSSWGISMNTSGNLVFTLGTNTSAITSSGMYNDGVWHQVVAVYSPGATSTTAGTASLYVDGTLDTSISTVSTNGIEPGSTMDVMIGSDPQFTNNPAGLGAQFAGQVCEVALFTNALTATQVQTLNTVAGVAPYVTGNPVTGRTVNGGIDSYIYFGVIADGSGPLAYQWYFNASSNYNGATPLVDNGVHYTNSTTVEVTVTNLTAADSGYYFVVITNSFGSVTSRLASLTVDMLPAIVSQSPAANLILFVNQSAALSVTASGATPLTYQWLTNGVADTSAGTASTYMVPPAQMAMSGITYKCAVTNAYGAVTSAPVMLTVLPMPPALTNSLYGSNVLALNPVAYWPMHEIEPAAQGDIETNYGTLGLLGTAYYPDWAMPGATAIERGVPGALANDPDQAVYFNSPSSGSTGPAAGTFTNVLYVPHTSPQATLNPPFSVECWFYPTNSASQDIWGQNGYEGLNSGSAGNAAGNVCGIRLVWENGTTTGFEVYTYRNSSANNTIGFSGISGQNVSPIGNWYHLVVTCDAQTNISLYTNGVLAFAAPAVTLYSPDYWTPLTIGGSRGGTKAVAGDIDEFAVYTNAITDMYQHYLDGTSESQAGTYVADVKSDNPAIYLRMDAPPVYTPPPPGAWPALTNYGTIGGISGLYTPGTMPGIVAGPFETNGIPFTGLSGGNVAQLSGISSFADAGDAAACSPSGSNANFSVTAMFRGNPCDNRVQSIVSHGTGSWELTVTTSGHVCFNAGNGGGTTPGTGQASGDVSTAGVYNDGNWHQVVAVNTTNQISIYVDGRLDTRGSPSGVGATSIIPGNSADVMIGSDPNFTNNPAGVGRQFAGQICEVAFFTNALTASQIGGLYVNTATNVGPFFAPAPPSSATAAPGATLVVPAGADGTSPIYYQWQIITNSVTNIVATGLTNGLPLNATLTADDVPAAWNGGQLELTVTNAYGASTVFVALSVVSPVNPNPTNVVFSVTNNQLVLSWPADHIGWTLQSQTNSLSVGISTNWVNVANSQTTNQILIPVNLANGSVFYRLVYTNN